MTVDLGFAWMTLPSGREVSIVDVPGHERFIKNMLAGVGGIDLAMLIVAADESVMPQTREHLAILDILRVTRGLVVVTKTDLVDEELVELVKAEVEDALAGTSFEGCPMVGVSAYTGDGIDELRGMIDSILDDTEARRDLGRPRLPIDRCFTISGFGTVVTGTLIDGSLAVGQEIELAGSRQRARIRGLQSHKTRVSSAEPGVRLAVNLSGISRDDIERGEILTSPGWLRPARRLDARLRMVNDAPHPMKHNEGVTFHLFTSESPARVRLLDADRLEAGAEGWVQLLLSEPLPLVKGDYFVIRSAESTLGGGQVVDPNPRRRHRRFDADVSERLMLLDEGASEDVIVSVAEQWAPCGLAELSRRANLPPRGSPGAGCCAGGRGRAGGFGGPGNRRRRGGLFGLGLGYAQGQAGHGSALIPRPVSLTKGCAGPGSAQPAGAAAARLPAGVVPADRRGICRRGQPGGAAARPRGDFHSTDGAAGFPLYASVGARTLFTAHRPAAGLRAARGPGGAGEGRPGRRLGGLHRRRLPGDDRAHRGAPAGAGQHRRRRGPDTVQHQPQIHSASAGADGPRADYPPLRGRAGVAVAPEILRCRC